MQLIVQADGSVRCLYAEILDIHSFGQLTISRGSYVEPGAAGEWFADLSPVSGPRLGPFPHRSVALEAEQAWLEMNWLLRTKLHQHEGEPL